jgi:hypothetical protein
VIVSHYPPTFHLYVDVSTILSSISTIALQSPSIFPSFLSLLHMRNPLKHVSFSTTTTSQSYDSKPANVLQSRAQSPARVYWTLFENDLMESGGYK